MDHLLSQRLCLLSSWTIVLILSSGPGHEPGLSLAVACSLRAPLQPTVGLGIDYGTAEKAPYHDEIPSWGDIFFTCHRHFPFT